MNKISIIGSGLIGKSWAIVFARTGFRVSLTDVDEACLEGAKASLDEMSRAAAEDGAQPFAEAISCTASLAEALDGAVLVQECGPESVEIKRRIFADLDRLAPEGAILASSSSSIVASMFSEDLPGRHRCLVAHPLNPPHLAPLVELCGAPWTDRQVVEAARRLYEAAGQVPIVMNREVEGFILNRLQAALLAEAFRLVGEGVISAPDLDKTVSDGLGLRWSFLGPFGTIELNAPGGIDDYVRRYGPAFKRITAEPPSPEVWDAENVHRVAESWGKPLTPDQRSARCAWRDQRLETLRKHKQSQDILIRS